MSKIRFVGLDVHADTIAIAVAEPATSKPSAPGPMICATVSRPWSSPQIVARHFW